MLDPLAARPPVSSRRAFRSPIVSLTAGLTVLLGTLPVALLAQPLQGQVFGALGGEPGRLVEPPRSIRQYLQDAQRAIEERRYSDAVVRLGDLLAREAISPDDRDVAGQDFFLDPPEERSGGPPATASLLRRAERMLGELPLQGRQTYESRYGAAARRLLEQASADGDWSALQRVSRQYLHTDAGREATWLLVYRQISQGRPQGALLLLDRLATATAAGSDAAHSVALLRAAALSRSGDRSAAEEILATLPESMSVRLAGSTVEVPPGPERPRWLEEHFSPLADRVRRGGTDQPLAGGGPDRSGVEGGSLPLSNPRWLLPTTSSSRQDRALRSHVAGAVSRGDLTAPTWQPIRVGNQLLMRTTERLVAVDFETGKRIWEYPWFSTSDEYDEGTSQLGIGLDQLPGEDAASDMLVQRVWNDVPYGRISSDGERVYLLSGLGEVEVMGQNAFAPAFGFRGMPAAESGTNTLVALELNTQGKLVWMIGSEGLDQEADELADAFFLGPPLPLDGELYVIAEVAGDILLLCLDPASGRVQWRQQLLALESGGIRFDALRRVGGAMPSYQDGVLICPTGAGAVVALDLASRSLLWAATYERSGELANNMMARGRGIDSGELSKRWLDSTAMIADGCVLITPVESEWIYCFDLLSGQLRWQPIRQVRNRAVAGIRDGRFLVLSNNRLLAYDLATGRPAWSRSTDLDGDEQIAGTGAFGDGVFYVPTTKQRILEVRWEDGEILGSRRTNYPVGNLLAVGDSLISQDATTLAAAYLEQPLAPQVAQRLETDAQDVWAITRRGELLMQQGELVEAFDWFRRALDLDPENEEARMLLVESVLGTLRAGETPTDEMLPRLDALIELPEQRIELLRLRVVQSLRQEEPAEAVEHLIALSSLVAADFEATRSRPTVLLDRRSEAEGTSGLDGWIAARTADLMAVREAEPLPRVRQRIAEHLEAYFDHPLSLQRHLVRQFGSLPEADPLRLAVIAASVREGAILAAERMTLDALHLADSPQRLGYWNSVLAAVYAAGDFGEDAQSALRSIAASGAKPAETLPAELSLPPRRDVLRGPLSELWPQRVRTSIEGGDGMRRRLGGRNEPEVMETIARRGEHLRGWRAVRRDGAQLALMDRMGQERTIDMEAGRREGGLPQAVFDGGLMIALLPHELVAVDLFRAREAISDSVLWRRPWRPGGSGRTVRSESASNPFQDVRRGYVLDSGDGSGMNTNLRLGPVVGGRFFLLAGRELTAIDVLRQEELWRVGEIMGTAHVVARDDRVAVISAISARRTVATGDERVTVFRADDGSEIERRPWQADEVVWATAGPHALTFQMSAGGYTIRLRDPIADAVVETAEVERIRGEGENERSGRLQTFGRVLDGRYLVLVDAPGRIRLWDLLEGTVLADQQVDPYPQLDGMQAMLRGDSVVILPMARSSEARDVEGRLQTASGEDHVRVDGRLTCVSLADGSVLWETPLGESPFGCSLHQPADAPLLVLTRSRSQQRTTSRRDNFLDVLAIDARTGAVASQLDDQPIPSNFNDIRTETHVDPLRQAVFVEIGPYRIQYEFLEPEPSGEEPRDSGAAEEEREEEAREEEASEEEPAKVEP